MTQHVRVFAFACVRVCAPTKKTTFFRWEKPRVTARWPIFGDLLTVAYLRWPNNPLTYFRWPTSGDLLTVTYFGWPTFGDHKVTTNTWAMTSLWPHIAHTPLSARTQLFFFSWQFKGLVLWSIAVRRACSMVHFGFVYFVSIFSIFLNFLNNFNIFFLQVWSSTWSS